MCDVRHLLIALAAMAGLTCATSAHASSFHVRTTTYTTFSQRLRLDSSIDAPRQLTQGLELHGYDLLESPSSPINAVAAFRFRQDFSEPLGTPFALDLLRLTWRPTPSLNLSMGRLWTSTALGPQDLDGGLLTWRPGLPGPISPYASAFVGRDLQHTRAPLAPTTFDVQGLPLYNDARSPNPSWIAGGEVGLAHTRALTLAAAYQTRWSRLEHTRITGEERLAASASLSLHEAHSTHGVVAYNTLLGRTEQISLQHVWLINERASIGMGASRRRPWFDAASIFNLFDPSPHDDLSLAITHRITSATRLDLKSWVRAYHGDEVTADWLRASPKDVRAVGTHIAQHSALRRPSHTLGLTTRASYQHSVPSSPEYPHQWLLDQRVDLSLPSMGPSLFARGIALRTTRPSHHRLPTRAHALSAILGVDTRQFSFARFSLQLEQRLTTYGASSLNVYASVDILKGL